MPNSFIENHIPLVKAVAARYRGMQVSFEDLVQEGLLGLIEAHKRYDSDRGTAFATYAMYWIKKNILLALSQENREAQAGHGNDDTAEEIADNGPGVSFDSLEGFPELESRVLLLSFEEGLPLNVIAKKLKISRERTRQLKKKALRRLRLNT